MAEQITPKYPILHSAIPGQNMYSITDSQGRRRWLNTGQTVDGWKIDKWQDNQLHLTNGKNTVKLGLGSGTITPYEVPTAQPNAELYQQRGMNSDYEQNMMNEMNNLKFKEETGMTIDEAKYYNEMNNFKRLTPSFMMDWKKSASQQENDKEQKYFQ